MTSLTALLPLVLLDKYTRTELRTLLPAFKILLFGTNLEFGLAATHSPLDVDCELQ